MDRDGGFVELVLSTCARIHPHTLCTLSKTSTLRSKHFARPCSFGMPTEKFSLNQLMIQGLSRASDQAVPHALMTDFSARSLESRCVHFNSVVFKDIVYSLNVGYELVFCDWLSQLTLEQGSTAASLLHHPSKTTRAQPRLQQCVSSGFTEWSLWITACFSTVVDFSLGLSAQTTTASDYKKVVAVSHRLTKNFLAAQTSKQSGSIASVLCFPDVEPSSELRDCFFLRERHAFRRDR